MSDDRSAPSTASGHEALVFVLRQEPRSMTRERWHPNVFNFAVVDQSLLARSLEESSHHNEITSESCRAGRSHPLAVSRVTRPRASKHIQGAGVIARIGRSPKYSTRDATIGVRCSDRAVARRSSRALRATARIVRRVTSIARFAFVLGLRLIPSLTSPMRCSSRRADLEIQSGRFSHRRRCKPSR